MDNKTIYDLITQSDNLQIIKFRDFIEKEVDLDVLNDYSDADYSAFVGPCILTIDGIDKYKILLDLDVAVNEDYSEATVLINDREDAGKCFRFLALFFNSFAGDISEREWERLFFIPNNV